MDANELANRVAREMFSTEGTGTAWGLTIEDVRAGYARLSMRVRPDMLNGHGFAHGGMIFALADSAFAYVCNGANHASVAAQASIIFLDKVTEGEILVAEAREVAREGRAGVTRVAVETQDGRRVAEFTGYSRTLGGAIIEPDPSS
ncbi:MAG TPA: hydroxyphenylacetyl-CoA thioesterase PaaI [Sphingomicrobium sp.]|nr:hydroxyphenylacetyl-CoA thioesterase PaaI [Sphingomicrobium sp.]